MSSIWRRFWKMLQFWLTFQDKHKIGLQYITIKSIKSFKRLKMCNIAPKTHFFSIIGKLFGLWSHVDIRSRSHLRYSPKLRPKGIMECYTASNDIYRFLCILNKSKKAIIHIMANLYCILCLSLLINTTCTSRNSKGS